jgi:hypothetical protein
MVDKQLCSSCLLGELVRSAGVSDYISEGPAIIRTNQSAPKVPTPIFGADVTLIPFFLFFANQPNWIGICSHPLIHEEITDTVTQGNP